MSRSSSSGVSFGTGAAAGVGAFIVGLVVTIVLAQSGISRYAAIFVGFGGLVNGSIIAFTSFHLWPLVLGGFGSGSGGFLVWTIVPVVVLVGAGYVAANSTGGAGGGGFKNGASITSGYLALTVLGFLLLLLQGGGGVDILSLLVGIVFTGVLFPVVFGGIGGVIADGT